MDRCSIIKSQFADFCNSVWYGYGTPGANVFFEYAVFNRELVGKVSAFFFGYICIELWDEC